MWTRVIIHHTAVPCSIIVYVAALLLLGFHDAAAMQAAASARRLLQDSAKEAASMPALAPPLSTPPPPPSPPPPAPRSQPPPPPTVPRRLPAPPPPPTPYTRRPPRPPPPAPYYYDYYSFFSPPPPRLPRPPPPPYYSRSSAPSSTHKTFSLVLFGLMTFLVPLLIGTYACSRFNHRSDAAAAAAALPASDINYGGPSTSDPPSRRSFIHKLPTLPFPAHNIRINPEENINLHSHSHGPLQKDISKESYTCAICISEYEKGEILKLLPACGHLFHKGCIDMWLFSHSNCPLCRLSLFNHKGDLILHDAKTQNSDGSDQQLANVSIPLP